MKTYLISAFLCFSSLFSLGQKLEKASPFTAVKWEKEQPVVKFNNNWYQLEKLSVFKTKELVDFCKKQYGSKWQKRFSEDLVEVINSLGHQPQTNVALELSKDGIVKSYTGKFTNENRNSVLLYNRDIEKANSMIPPASQKIPVTEALADLNQFEEILTATSSYSQLSTYDYRTAIKEIADSIRNENTQFSIDQLTKAIGKILSEIGDRHSSVKNDVFDKKNHHTYNLKLPFAVAALNGKLIGLKKNPNNENYNYYYHSFPYIKSIHGIATETLIDNNYRDKKAPLPSKLSRGSAAIQKFGSLLFDHNIKCPDSVKVVFSNGSNEKTEIFQLTTVNNGYVSKLVQDHEINRDMMSKSNFNGLSKILAYNIGYINIPEMFHYDEVTGLENFIKETFKSYSNTKALIIDIRNNPGGGREILQTFAAYIIQAAQSPWVANVAYLRNNQNIDGDEKSMSDRYLYSYSSDKFSANDRKTINHFIENFKTEKQVYYAKFSKPFYMLLRSGSKPYTQPVYILVNEQSFSAASVFASAFKGLQNVKIVGETTDGSSGNSESIYLKNSNIKINISTMLSFQRNGKTLDGNGTIPDIIIKADENQVLKGNDSQLNKLVKLIIYFK